MAQQVLHDVRAEARYNDNNLYFMKQSPFNDVFRQAGFGGRRVRISLKKDCGDATEQPTQFLNWKIFLTSGK